MPRFDGEIPIEGPRIENGETVEVTSVLGPEGEIERAVVTDVYREPLEQPHSWTAMLAQLADVMDNGIPGLEDNAGAVPIVDDGVWFTFTARMRFNSDGSFDVTRVEAEYQVIDPEAST